MKITVERDVFNKSWTQGRLSVDGVFLCYTLEDTDRFLEAGGLDDKVKGETAIPRGEYKLTLSMSNRFKKVLPEVLGVKYFTGIRIHAGNTVDDTDGCILVGMNRIGAVITHSQMALSHLMKLLENTDEEVIIEVK